MGVDLKFNAIIGIFQEQKSLKAVLLMLNKGSVAKFWVRPGLARRSETTRHRRIANV